MPSLFNLILDTVSRAIEAIFTIPSFTGDRFFRTWGSIRSLPGKIKPNSRFLGGSSFDSSEYSEPIFSTTPDATHTRPVHTSWFHDDPRYLGVVTQTTPSTPGVTNYYQTLYMPPDPALKTQTLEARLIYALFLGICLFLLLFLVAKVVIVAAEIKRKSRAAALLRALGDGQRISSILDRIEGRILVLEKIKTDTERKIAENKDLVSSTRRKISSWVDRLQDKICALENSKEETEVKSAENKELVFSTERKVSSLADKLRDRISALEKVKEDAETKSAEAASRRIPGYILPAGAPFEVQNRLWLEEDSSADVQTYDEFEFRRVRTLANFLKLTWNDLKVEAASFARKTDCAIDRMQDRLADVESANGSEEVLQRLVEMEHLIKKEKETREQEMGQVLQRHLDLERLIADEGEVREQGTNQLLQCHKDLEQLVEKDKEARENQEGQLFQRHIDLEQLIENEKIAREGQTSQLLQHHQGLEQSFEKEKIAREGQTSQLLQHHQGLEQSFEKEKLARENQTHKLLQSYLSLEQLTEKEKVVREAERDQVLDRVKSLENRPEKVWVGPASRPRHSEMSARTFGGRIRKPARGTRFRAALRSAVPELSEQQGGHIRAPVAFSPPPVPWNLLSAPASPPSRPAARPAAALSPAPAVVPEASSIPLPPSALASPSGVVQSDLPSPPSCSPVVVPSDLPPNLPALPPSPPVDRSVSASLGLPSAVLSFSSSSPAPGPPPASDGLPVASPTPSPGPTTCAASGSVAASAPAVLLSPAPAVISAAPVPASTSASPPPPPQVQGQPAVPMVYFRGSGAPSTAPDLPAPFERKFIAPTSRLGVLSSAPHQSFAGTSSAATPSARPQGVESLQPVPAATPSAAIEPPQPMQGVESSSSGAPPLGPVQLTELSQGGESVQVLPPGQEAPVDNQAMQGVEDLKTQPLHSSPQLSTQDFEKELTGILTAYLAKDAQKFEMASPLLALAGPASQPMQGVEHPQTLPPSFSLTEPVQDEEGSGEGLASPAGPAPQPMQGVEGSQTPLPPSLPVALSFEPPQPQSELGALPTAHIPGLGNPEPTTRKMAVPKSRLGKLSQRGGFHLPLPASASSSLAVSPPTSLPLAPSAAPVPQGGQARSAVQGGQDNLPQPAQEAGQETRPPLVLVEPGCNLRGCYKPWFHDHTEEEFEEFGWHGMWICIFCQDTFDHSCFANGRFGWEWQCWEVEDCHVRTKHEHLEEPGAGAP